MVKIKNYLKFVQSHLMFVLLLSIIIGGIMAISIYYFYNPTHDVYQITFRALSLDSDKIVTEDYIISIKDKIEGERIQGYNEETQKYPYSSFDYVDTRAVAKGSSIEKKDDLFVLRIEKRQFNSWQQARRFMKRMITDSSENPIYILRNGEEVTSDNSKVLEESIVVNIGSQKEYVFFLYGMAIGFGVSLIILLILHIVYKEALIDTLPYDNERIFKTPFHLNYFKVSVKEVKSLRNCVTIAILFALQLCAKFIPLPSGFGNLGLGIGYLVFSIISMLYGPIAGITIGFCSDIIGYIVKPDGVFFLGYTLSAMLSGLIYALCLYRTRVSFMKCLFARIFVNLFVNTVLGTLWWWIINDYSFSFSWYLLTMELPKNLVYLLPQSALMYFVIKSLSKPLLRAQLIDEEIALNIRII